MYRFRAELWLFGGAQGLFSLSCVWFRPVVAPCHRNIPFILGGRKITSRVHLPTAVPNEASDLVVSVLQK